jgi:hypothetical protein
MEPKKENPSKVVIVPRPPRCAKPELTPIDQAEPAAAAQNANPAALNHTILPGEPPQQPGRRTGRGPGRRTGGEIAMKRLGKMLATAVFAAAGLFATNALMAQDAPPGGSFKNAYLSRNKSGKVVLTYTLWDQQVPKGNYTLASSGPPGPMKPATEVPYILEIAKKYAGKVKVLGVTYGDEIQDSMDAIPEWGMTFPSIVFVEDAPPDWAVRHRHHPDSHLFGPDGTIVKRDIQGDEIEAAVKEALKL